MLKTFTLLLLSSEAAALVLAVNIGLHAQQAASPRWFDRFLGRGGAAGVTVSTPTSAAPSSASPSVVEFMTSADDLITLSPEQPLKAAAQALLDAKITGAPVVEKGVLVGVISRTDLLYKLAGLRSLAVAGMGPRSLRYMDNTQRLMKVDAVKVQDAMTSSPISVTPQATMQDAATIMLRKKLNRIMVATKEGELKGMVTASDVVRLTLEADFDGL
jgi:CBS domain-containing protein